MHQRADGLLDKNIQKKMQMHESTWMRERSMRRESHSALTLLESNGSAPRLDDQRPQDIS